MIQLFDNIFALGDLHGKWQPVRDLCLANKLKYKMTEKSNALILLGDSGLNFFFNHRDDGVKTKLSNFPFTYFVVRGNHEERPSICMQNNPTEWYTEQFWGNTVYVENKYPNIKYAEDKVAIYSIPCKIGEEVKNLKTLVVPGAYSVDKAYRLANGWSWFEQEQLSEAEQAAGMALVNNSGLNYDLVLSHTCPIIYEPTDLFLSFIDQSLVDKTMERYLGNIEFGINYKLWLWGHYHAVRIYPPFKEGRPIMLFNRQGLDVVDYFIKHKEFGVNFEPSLLDT